MRADRGSRVFTHVERLLSHHQHPMLGVLPDVLVHVERSDWHVHPPRQKLHLNQGEPDTHTFLGHDHVTEYFRVWRKVPALSLLSEGYKSELKLFLTKVLHLSWRFVRYSPRQRQNDSCEPLISWTRSFIYWQGVSEKWMTVRVQVEWSQNAAVSSSKTNELSPWSLLLLCCHWVCGL